ARPGRRGARVAVVLLFVALLATPLVMRWLAADGGGDAALSVEEAIARHGFALREVAGDIGIAFVHEAPALDPKLEPIMPAVAAFGASVSVVDFDRDGWHDLYVTSSGIGSRNALYRNKGDGSFEDVAAAMGLADVNRRVTGVSMGAVWGDYDNDGYEDLFLYRWGRPALFHNDAGRGFTPVDGAGFPDWINANTAVWFDYDGDGWLDLFVGGFYPAELDLWDLEDTRMMPESFEFAQNGGRNYLFRNRGDGTFEDVAEAMGLTTRRWTLAAATADVDRDGDPDLFVANDFGINELYLNDGDRFRDVGRAANLAHVPKSGMNASFGDVLNRGDWTLFVTNISEPGVLIHGNDLWMPTHGDGGAPGYRNLAGAMGVELAGFAFGAQFGDLDNDGWLDLFVASGYYSGPSRESYWYDYSKVAGGHSGIIGDARHWPAMRGRSLSGYQQDRVWRNDGAGRFHDVTRAVGAASHHDGRAVAFADLWNRGVLDVVVANQRGPLLVYRNTVAPANAWIAFELEGRRSNRSAIGAEIRLYRGGMSQVRQIEGGNGFAAQNQRRAHFGLGAGATVDSVVIRWPSGVVRTLPSPAVNTLHRVVEPL
ncbi:MAG TPA: CRTAC1 family protein, partial [Longimicrobiales bacterium]|nr:CRTAC1 family protein [Longimicrobiales bacterium]